MSKLVESILENDLVSAQAIFEERIAAIAERKLLEVKKMVQEQTFPSGRAGVEARKKAGFRRAIDVLGDPTAARKKPLVKVKKKKTVKEAVDVQPDPEGRVRGGKARPDKGTIRRKVAAAVLKAGRKAGSAAGEAAVRLSRARGAWKQYQAQKKSQFPDDMHQTQTPKKSGELTGNSPSAIAQRVKSHAKAAIAQADAKRMRKSAWERSVGGKVAPAAIGAAKLGGRIIGSMLSGMDE